MQVWLGMSRWFTLRLYMKIIIAFFLRAIVPFAGTNWPLEKADRFIPKEEFFCDYLFSYLSY